MHVCGRAVVAHACKGSHSPHLQAVTNVIISICCCCLTKKNSEIHILLCKYFYHLHY